MNMTAQEKTEKDTKEALLASAIEIFSQKGFDGTTVKDLSEAAGVNISLVSYHFGGKEGLYNACLEKFGQGKLQTLGQILTPSESVEDFKAKVKIWVTQFAHWSVEEGAKVRMIHREMDCGLPIMKEAFRSTFIKTFELIKDFIKDAQTKKFIRSDLDHEELAGLLQGALINAVRLDPIRKEFFGKTIHDETYRKHYIDQILNIIFKGILHE